MTRLHPGEVTVAEAKARNCVRVLQHEEQLADALKEIEQAWDIALDLSSNSIRPGDTVKFSFYKVYPLPSRAARMFGKISSRGAAADAVLIFVTTPDHADAILGDLLEQMKKIRERHSAFWTWLWFWWEVAWVVIEQGGARVREHTLLGRLADAFVRRIGS